MQACRFNAAKVLVILRKISDGTALRAPAI